VEKAGPRNPRDTGSGQFRTFQGELAEAKQALAEGRMSDVVELLGSARALAQTDQQRMSLGELQGAIGRTQHIQPEITKVGPHGYSHGWIKAGEGDGPHTHQTEDLPDKVQVGAFNYRKHPDGSYSRHHPGTGNRATSSADRDRYSADELKDLSRSQDGRGSFVMPARPIGSVKEPLRRAQKAKPVVEG
jgi:hypothetical protein